MYQTSENNAMYWTFPYKRSNQDYFQYPIVNFTHELYSYRGERDQQFVKRSIKPIIDTYDYFINSIYFDYVPFEPFAVLCFDIMTYLGGNKLDNAVYTKPVIDPVEHDAVRGIFAKYAYDFKMSFAIHHYDRVTTILTDDDLIKRVIDEIIKCYVKYRHNNA